MRAARYQADKPEPCTLSAHGVQHERLSEPTCVHADTGDGGKHTHAHMHFLVPIRGGFQHARARIAPQAA